jgi:hypothetical protein
MPFPLNTILLRGGSVNEKFSFIEASGFSNVEHETEKKNKNKVP